MATSKSPRTEIGLLLLREICAWSSWRREEERKKGLLSAGRFPLSASSSHGCSSLQRQPGPNTESSIRYEPLTVERGAASRSSSCCSWYRSILVANVCSHSVLAVPFPVSLPLSASSPMSLSTAAPSTVSRPFTPSPGDGDAMPPQQYCTWVHPT
jgi:hypothetical protein